MCGSGPRTDGSGRAGTGRRTGVADTRTGAQDPPDGLSRDPLSAATSSIRPDAGSPGLSLVG